MLVVRSTTLTLIVDKSGDYLSRFPSKKPIFSQYKLQSTNRRRRIELQTNRRTLRVRLYWNIFDFKRKMRVSKRAVGLFYLRAMLLYNMRSCLYPNATAQYFTCLLAIPVE